MSSPRELVSEAAPSLQVGRRLEVMIVSYNTRDLTRLCLASVERLVRPEGLDLAVALLDNASADGTADMVREEFPHVRLLEEPHNVFYGPACNTLVATSDADLVMMLNADAQVPPDLVEALLAPLAEDAVMVTYPAIEYPDGAVVEPHDRFPTLGYEVALQLKGTRLADRLKRFWDADAVVARQRAPLPADRGGPDVMFVHSTCWLMRRTDALAVGPFDDRFPMYDVDLDMSRRLDTAGRRAVMVPARISHVGGASSPSTAKRRMMLAGRARYYRVHHSRLHELAYRGLQLVPELKRLRHRTR